jgi:hypothetical protein
MRRKREFGIRISDVGFLCVLLFMFAETASAQSLADAARKERERQQQVRGTVTITSGVDPVTGLAAATAAGTARTTAGVTAVIAAGTSGTTAQKATGPVDNQGRGETYWRDVFQKARDDVRRAEERVQVLDLKIKDMNTQLLQNSLIYNREYRIGAEITTAQQELETARKEADAARQRLLSLEDDLRRAGGLPGWAR